MPTALPGKHTAECIKLKKSYLILIFLLPSSARDRQCYQRKLTLRLARKSALLTEEPGEVEDAFGLKISNSGEEGEQKEGGGTKERDANFSSIHNR